jgi:hypothetical protein
MWQRALNDLAYIVSIKQRARPPWNISQGVIFRFLGNSPYLLSRIILYLSATWDSFSTWDCLLSRIKTISRHKYPWRSSHWFNHSEVDIMDGRFSENNICCWFLDFFGSGVCLGDFFLKLTIRKYSKKSIIQRNTVGSGHKEQI